MKTNTKHPNYIHAKRNKLSHSKHHKINKTTQKQTHTHTYKNNKKLKLSEHEKQQTRQTNKNNN